MGCAAFVSVSEVDHDMVSGVLVSGLNFGLTGRNQRRVDQMCMRVRPQFPQTEIKMDVNNLYREETFTDNAVGTLRRLTPSTS